MEALFEHVLAFDENDDGFIDGAEMKRYLAAVGAWVIPDRHFRKQLRNMIGKLV